MKLTKSDKQEGGLNVSLRTAQNLRKVANLVAAGAQPSRSVAGLLRATKSAQHAVQSAAQHVHIKESATASQGRERPLLPSFIGGALMASIYSGLNASSGVHSRGAHAS